MYGAFEKSFGPATGQVPQGEVVRLDTGIPGLAELIARFGGLSFANGLYRIIRAADFAAWRERVGMAFPKFADRIMPFAYDWMGRAFALDRERIVGDQPGVTIFEPGIGHILQVPANIVALHDRALIEHAGQLLETDWHQQWLKRGNPAPRFDQCVGYKKPLFLGGVDGIKNFEMSDLDVYWHIMGQLLEQVRNLPKGTPIGGITFQDKR